mmetsp:Transcript_38602/g.43845  ORF Transcript_38602/g.43845 Transcript_38602/m.43845 type:complete len:134 (+) Transcript_38602:320-721(+)
MGPRKTTRTSKKIASKAAVATGRGRRSKKQEEPEIEEEVEDEVSSHQEEQEEEEVKEETKRSTRTRVRATTKNKNPPNLSVNWNLKNWSMNFSHRLERELPSLKIMSYRLKVLKKRRKMILTELSFRRRVMMF